VEEVKTLENTTITAIQLEQLQQISDGIGKINTYLGVFLVIGGIVISFLVVQFLWRYLFKSVLRDYVKLPI
jgi:hypothetical protein